MTQQQLENIAVMVALNLGLDPSLVCAVCARESSWNPDATRYEAGFYSRYISSMKGLSDEEKTLRATSFGLMQIMGQTAREQGFDGNLETLFEPVNSLTQGCKKLRSCLARESNDVQAALLRYNGGGATDYPALVMKHYADYAKLPEHPDESHGAD